MQTVLQMIVYSVLIIWQSCDLCNGEGVNSITYYNKLYFLKVPWANPALLILALYRLGNGVDASLIHKWIFVTHKVLINWIYIFNLNVFDIKFNLSKICYVQLDFESTN